MGKDEFPRLLRLCRELPCRELQENYNEARRSPLNLGHEVIPATSGEDALALMQQRSIDVVISDLGLGAGMSGWDLALEIERTSPATRFVLATGWGASIDPEAARRRGIDAVLAKPYRLADLQRAVLG